MAISSNTSSLSQVMPDYWQSNFLQSQPCSLLEMFFKICKHAWQIEQKYFYSYLLFEMNLLPSKQQFRTRIKNQIYSLV